jgi:hypothetical protein
MSEPFETRLESMERRLAEIQRELAPEAQPRTDRPETEPIPLRPPRRARAGAASSERPVREPLRPAPEAVRPPGGARAEPAPADLELLGELYGDLLGSVRRLLDGYEAALRRLSHPMASAPAAGDIEITAGPFASMAALREFERALAKLPAVRDVSLRGYQSGDRAILEVQLEQETT